MQKTKKFFTMGMQKIKDFGEWLLNYIPSKPKVVESFKNKIKTCMKREIVCFNQHRPNCFEEFCDSVSNKRIKWLRPRIIFA